MTTLHSIFIVVYLYELTTCRDHFSVWPKVVAKFNCTRPTQDQINYGHQSLYDKSKYTAAWLCGFWFRACLFHETTKCKYKMFIYLWQGGEPLPISDYVMFVPRHHHVCLISNTTSIRYICIPCRFQQEHEFSHLGSIFCFYLCEMSISPCCQCLLLSRFYVRILQEEMSVYTEQ